METLDDLDQRLIRELRADGRRPAKTIARNLGVVEATIASRIRALSERNAIRIMAQRNVNAMRHRHVCLLEVEVRGRAVDEVATDLARLEDTASINICTGSPQITVCAFVDDHTDAIVRLCTAIGDIAGVDQLSVDIALETRIYRSDFGTLTPPSPIPPPTGADLEARIIEQLQVDGRASTREIGRILDVPASTVRERMNRLLESKAIRIGIVCDAASLGFSAVAYARLRVSTPLLGDALRHLERRRDFGQVISTTGEFNVFVLFAIHDLAHLVRITRDIIEAAPGLRESKVRLISATKKHRVDLIQIV